MVLLTLTRALASRFIYFHIVVGAQTVHEAAPSTDWAMREVTGLAPGLYAVSVVARSDAGDGPPRHGQVAARGRAQCTCRSERERNPQKCGKRMTNRNLHPGIVDTRENKART